jgi:hypothetical protein
MPHIASGLITGYGGFLFPVTAQAFTKTRVTFDSNAADPEDGPFAVVHRLDGGPTINSFGSQELEGLRLEGTDG